MTRWVPEEYKKNVTHLELLTSRTQRRATTVISLEGINYILKASRKKHVKILKTWIDDGEMQLSHMQKDAPVEEAEEEEVIVEEIPAEKAGNDVIIDKSLQIFSNPEFGDLRVIMRGGEPWFIAGEVAEELGYSNVRDAVARHCKSVAKHDVSTLNGIRKLSVIPEKDIYRLIMRSNLPRAEEFQDWVVGDVLPAIRKTGAYMPEEWLKKMMKKGN